jgi:hypothetical protein
MKYTIWLTTLEIFVGVVLILIFCIDPHGTLFSTQWETFFDGALCILGLVGGLHLSSILVRSFDD